METFGCCSRYMDCSENGSCIHNDDSEYLGCQYNKNLKQGKIFYLSSKRLAGEEVQQIKSKRRPEIFLKCYDRFFAIKRKDNWYSRDLNDEQASEIKSEFDRLGIPYSIEASSHEIDIVDEQFPEPCNSRVFIEIGKVQYHVLNSNYYMIKNAIAKKISAAFQAKGLISRVDLIGKTTLYKTMDEHVQKSHEIDQATSPIIEEVSNTVQEFMPIKEPERLKEQKPRSRILDLYFQGHSPQVITKQIFLERKTLDKSLTKLAVQAEVEQELVNYFLSYKGG